MNILKEAKEAPKDIRLLWLSVFLRLLAYGLTNQVLTLFLNAIGMKEDRIGLFMSLTLVGDVLCSYVLTWYADAWGRRKVLIYGSVMMCLSGIVFSISENFHVLLVFAIFGVISPSSNEVGPFKSIEESMIAHLSPNNKRPEIYAMHQFLGTCGSALGAIASGGFIHVLKRFGFARDNLQCYKLVFLIYALFAFAKVIVMFCLSEKTELDGHFHELLDENSMGPAMANDEMAPLMQQAAEQREREEAKNFSSTSIGSVSDSNSNFNSSTTAVERGSSSSSSGTGLSKETISVLMRLLVIFMTDSLGAGFMTSGWMVYYYKRWFHMGSLGLGILFFVAQLVMSTSTVASSTIARLFGPVRATLLVQIPSAVFSILIPVASNHLYLSIFLLNLHFATESMDVTPRQILLTNLIRPRDLTKVMGVVNIGKTFARCVGPIFTGILAGKGYLWLCYVISGSLVITADMILACSFLHVDGMIKKQIT